VSTLVDRVVDNVWLDQASFRIEPGSIRIRNGPYEGDVNCPGSDGGQENSAVAFFVYLAGQDLKATRIYTTLGDATLVMAVSPADMGVFAFNVN
jgi:hypothetical protein